MLDPVSTAAVVAPLTSKVVDTAVEHGIDDAIDRAKSTLKSERRRQKFDRELDQTSTVFHENLQKSLKIVAKEKNDQRLEAIANEWNPNTLELHDIQLAFESKEDAADQICDAIEAHILSDQNVSVSSHELRPAIETAYTDALVRFAENLEGTELTETLQFEFDRNLVAEIRELSDQLDVIDRYLGRYEDFIEIHPQQNDEWQSDVSRALADGEYYQTYIEPSNLTEATDAQQVLVVGRAGTGKTRALLESLETFEDEIFDRIIIPTESFNTLHDVNPLRNRSYEGDVLLIWDDIHEFVKADEAVEAVLQKLKQKVRDDGHQLWVRATIRREEFDEVFDDQDRPDRLSSDFWQSFETAEIDTPDYYDEERISHLVDDAVAKYDLDVPDYLRPQFVNRVLETDPSPEYIEAICQTIADESDGVVTEEYLEQLPEGVLDAWKHRCERLAGQETSRYQVLQAISVADRLNIPLNVTLVDYLYDEWLDGESMFSVEVEYLESRGWFGIQESSAKSQIRIHDLRLEAVEETVPDLEHNPGQLDELNAALHRPHFRVRLDQADSHPDLPAIVHTRFGKFLAETLGEYDEFLEMARENFIRATELNTQTPEIHLTYATFLAEQGDFMPASEQYRIANEIGTTVSTVRKRDALDEIDYLVEVKGLNQVVENVAGVIVEQWEDATGLMGRDGRIIGGAAILVASRQFGQPVSLSKTAEAIRLTKEDFPNVEYQGNVDQYIKSRLNQAQQSVSRRLGYELPPKEAEQLIDAFYSDIEYDSNDNSNDIDPEDVRNISKEMISTIKKIDDAHLAGNNPNAVAASAMWMACQFTGVKFTQKKLADIAGIRTVSLRNRRDDMVEFYLENNVAIEQWCTVETMPNRIQNCIEKIETASN